MRSTLRLLLVLGLFLTSSAFAAHDVDIVSFTADKTTVQAGEEITLTIRVKNHGPDTSTGVSVSFSNNYDARIYPLSSSTPAGWGCHTAHFACFGEAMPPNAEVTLTYHVVVPATYREDPLTISMFGGAFGDSNSQNNHAKLALATRAADRSADLSLAISGPPSPIAAGTHP